MEYESITGLGLPTRLVAVVLVNELELGDEEMSAQSVYNQPHDHLHDHDLRQECVKPLVGSH